MRFGDDDLVWEAIVALDEVCEIAQTQEIPPSYALRFVLAFLFSRSDGNREPYDAFWRYCRSAGVDELTQAATIRGTYTRTAWNRIVRGLGLQQTIAFGERLALARRPPIEKVREQFAAAVRRKGKEQGDLRAAKIAANSCGLDRPELKL